jgi:hypothetical protein
MNGTENGFGKKRKVSKESFDAMTTKENESSEK